MRYLQAAFYAHRCQAAFVSLTLKHSKMPSSDMSPALPRTTSTPILVSSSACAALNSVINSAESKPGYTAHPVTFACKTQSCHGICKVSHVCAACLPDLSSCQMQCAACRVLDSVRAWPKQDSGSLNGTCLTI